MATFMSFHELLILYEIIMYFILKGDTRYRGNSKIIWIDMFYLKVDLWVRLCIL